MKKKAEETTEKLNLNQFFFLFLVSPAPNESVLRLWRLLIKLMLVLSTQTRHQLGLMEAAAS